MAARRRPAKQKMPNPKAASQRAARRIALFVEGTVHLTPSHRNDLQELWRYQCQKLSAFPPEQLDVYGFNKQQILLMDPAHRQMAAAGKIPLDVAIEREHKALPFQTLIVAFDAHPANQAIQLIQGQLSPCFRLEKDFVLRSFAESAMLPEEFRTEAARLLAHYHANRATPRPAARPPLGDVELVYMDPMFESLVLQDAHALRAVFGLKRTPHTWPALPHTGDRPDWDLGEIVGLHWKKAGPKHLRLPYRAAKHAWAQEVLKKASANSAIWAHPIAARLKKVLS